MNKFVLPILLLSVGCSNNHFLQKKITAPKNCTIDTLEQYPGQAIQIVNLNDEGAMGNFSVHPAIIKEINGSGKIFYEIEKGENEWVRLSKDYVAFVKPHIVLNRGWFLIKNGVIVNQLPGMDKLFDSIKKSQSNDISFKVLNGYISILKNGEKIQELNYGNIANSKLQKVNFDSLDYGLYRLVGDSLINVSAETNDFRIQKDDLFYLPAPGYDVVRKYSKSMILKMVDSVTKLSQMPDEIFVRPV